MIPSNILLVSLSLTHSPLLVSVLFWSGTPGLLNRYSRSLPGSPPAWLTPNLSEGLFFLRTGQQWAHQGSLIKTETKRHPSGLETGQKNQPNYPSSLPLSPLPP